MQRLFTVECRVDFRDETKVDVAKAIMQSAAQLVMGQMGLLGDAVKPEMAIYSHDYFTGHEDIPLFDQQALAGQAAIDAAAGPSADDVAMLNALKR